MFCWSCGHKNPDINKFCGDCGKAQVRAPVFVEEDTITDNIKTTNPKTMTPPPQERQRVPEKLIQPVAAPVAPPPGTGIAPTTQRFVSTNPLIGESRVIKEIPIAPTAVVADPAKPVSAPIASAAIPREAPRSATRISGPSFLGLSDEPESSSEPSEYLLDDEQESSSTARSYVALGLILLLGVLLYKQWDSVSAAGRDLIQRAQAVTSSTTVPTRQPEIAAKEPTKASVYHGIGEDAKPQGDSASPVEATTEEKTTADAAVKDSTVAAAETAPTEDAKAAGKTTDSPASDSETEEASEKVALGGSLPETPAVAAKTDSRARSTSPTPPVYDDSQIDLAQKYLQGRGVAQDCNRGVSLLRSAAAQSNPKAQIKLGALYATGHCVTQDRAEAYRWFAEAQQVQPGNQWIDKNLNSLWAEMTPMERSRAQR